MKKGMWKPKGFSKALVDAKMEPEALAVELQELGWQSSIHSVLDWRSDRSGGPLHLVQAEVIAEILGCKLVDIMKTKKGAGRG